MAVFLYVNLDQVYNNFHRAMKQHKGDMISKETALEELLDALNSADSLEHDDMDGEEEW